MFASAKALSHLQMCWPTWSATPVGPADRVPCTHAFPRLLEFEVLDVPVAQLVCEGSDDLTRCARNYSLTQCVYVIALVHCGHGVRVAGVKLDARTGCSVARLSPRRLEVV